MISEYRTNPQTYLEKQSAPKKIAQPAELLAEWRPWLRKLAPECELDFSWARDAITICDLRTPSALRYADLYTRAEICEGRHEVPDDFERRVGAFMARG